MRTKRAEAVAENIMATTQKVFGNNVKAGKTFNVEPSIAQKMEERVQQQNAFLKLINVIPVNDVSGQVLGFGAPRALMKRTTSETATGFHKRRPTNPSGLKKRDYKCEDYESDALITWEQLDQWAHLPDYYQKFRTIVQVAQATDRLRLGWHGQYRADNTDPVANPQLEDMQRGWLQYLIENAPEQVLGISPSQTDPLGYTVDPIHVGVGAGANGFESLDSLVYHLRQTKIDKIFRFNTNNVAILGDELVSKDNQGLFDGAISPLERVARAMYLESQDFGRTKIERSDEYPERGLMVTQTSLLSYYYQAQSIRRKIEDDHEEKGIVDYNYGRHDFVIEVCEGAAAVHPDAIHLKDKDGNWVPAADTWKAVIQ